MILPHRMPETATTSLVKTKKSSRLKTKNLRLFFNSFLPMPRLILFSIKFFDQSYKRDLPFLLHGNTYEKKKIRAAC